MPRIRSKAETRYATIDKIDDVATYIRIKKQRPEGVIHPKDDVFLADETSLDKLGRFVKPVQRLDHAFLWSQVPDFPNDRLFHCNRPSYSTLIQAHDNWMGEMPQRWFANGAPLSREQIEATRFWEACAELQRSPAGEKATHLLMEFLAPWQRETLELYGTFDVLCPYKLLPKVLNDRGELAWTSRRPRRIKIDVYPYFRSSEMIAGKVLRDFCWHPADPIPSADLALIHLLQIRESPREYFQLTNW